MKLEKFNIDEPTSEEMAWLRVTIDRSIELGIDGESITDIDAAIYGNVTG